MDWSVARQSRRPPGVKNFGYSCERLWRERTWWSVSIQRGYVLNCDVIKKTMEKKSKGDGEHKKGMRKFSGHLKPFFYKRGDHVFQILKMLAPR